MREQLVTETEVKLLCVCEWGDRRRYCHIVIAVRKIEMITSVSQVGFFSDS